MTRPRKQTVEWFPHACHHGKTIFVLEKRYNLAGYAFWFKLLEMLGNSEGHYIDTKVPAVFEYLQAYTGTTEETCTEIVNLLSSLEAIDPDLWNHDRVIWSDNFVRGIAEVYRHRTTKLPSKPCFPRGKHSNKGVFSEKTRGKSVEEVEEGSRVEEGEKKKYAAPGSDEPDTALFFSCQFFDIDPSYRLKLAKEYPLLTDELLVKEFSRMEDWISDNRKTKKFKANGHLASPKNFIRNWLDRLTINPTGKGGGGKYGGEKGNGGTPRDTSYDDLSE